MDATLTKTTGVEMTFDIDGKSKKKTLSGMKADVISDTTKAKSFARDVKVLVKGNLTGAVLVTRDPVELD